MYSRDRERVRKGKKWLFTRVARWYIFRPKISIWVNFGGL
jgi:hypothetical protein